MMRMNGVTSSRAKELSVITTHTTGQKRYRATDCQKYRGC